MSEPAELDGMNLIQLLDLLVELSEPAPISYWPQTMAWLVLLIVFSAACVLIAGRSYQHYRRNAYRRQALTELASVSGSATASEQISSIAAIVRRVALISFRRDEVTETLGQAWLAFLDKTCPGVGFDSATGQLIVTGPYQKRTAASASEISALIALATHWIKQHQAEKHA